MPQQTHGLASVVDAGRYSPSTNRHYSGTHQAPAHAHAVYVKHNGSDWKPSHTGGMATASQAYGEHREEMLHPITGVRLVDAKGKVVKEETVREAALEAVRAEKPKRYHGRPMGRKKGAKK